MQIKKISPRAKGEFSPRAKRHLYKTYVKRMCVSAITTSAPSNGLRSAESPHFYGIANFGRCVFTARVCCVSMRGDSVLWVCVCTLIYLLPPLILFPLPGGLPKRQRSELSSKVSWQQLKVSEGTRGARDPLKQNAFYGFLMLLYIHIICHQKSSYIAI